MMSNTVSLMRRACGPSALALALACGGTAAATGNASVATSPAPQRPAPAVAISGDSAGILKARADSARLPYTAADIHFMSGMIHHHSQAVEMSRLAPTHGASAAVLRLADRIINAQVDEITTMQQWLRDRRQPVPEAKGGPMMMTMPDGMRHEMLMPGMMSAEQMRRLDQARGREFDRLFLTYMIQHHRGATQMVRELFATPGAGQSETVFKFATDVNVDQTTEIARMETMLAAMTSPGAP